MEWTSDWWTTQGLSNSFSSTAPAVQGVDLGPNAPFGGRVSCRRDAGNVELEETLVEGRGWIPGRLQVALNGHTPRLSSQDAVDISNPYIKALQAHREEVQKGFVDWEDLKEDSLASRLATQRQDALASLDTSEAPIEWTRDFDFRCGPIECAERRSEAGELGEVLFSQRQGYLSEVLHRRPSRHQQLDDIILCELPDTGRSSVDTRESEAVPCCKKPTWRVDPM